MNPRTFFVAIAVAPSAFAASFADVRVAFDPAGPYQTSTAAAPGNTLFFEVRLRTDSATHVGLAGATYQLRIDGWHATNTLLPWSPSFSSAAEGGPGVHGETARGRVAPFAAADAASLPTSGLDNTTLTIGGTGPGEGIATSQLPQSLAINSFGSYFNPSTDAAVFRFAMTVGPGSDVLQLTVTPTAFTNNVVRWYDSPTGAQATNDDLPTANISPAQVFFVPTPGVLALAVVTLIPARPRR